MMLTVDHAAIFGVIKGRAPPLKISFKCEHQNFDTLKIKTIETWNSYLLAL